VQEVTCACQPGYTGKYCQFVTAVRFDGSYAIASDSGESLMGAEAMELSFQFRVGFFHAGEERLPLIYLADGKGRLIFEVTVHRRYLSVENRARGVSERLAFYYPYSAAAYEDYDQIWHSLQIRSGSEGAQVTYSVKKMHLFGTKKVCEI